MVASVVLQLHKDALITFADIFVHKINKYSSINVFFSQNNNSCIYQIILKLIMEIDFYFRLIYLRILTCENRPFLSFQ